MDLLTGIFSAFGLSASAGLNAYIPLLAIALLARFTNLIQLKAPWDTLASDWIIGLLLVLSLIEFFADKVPAVNHINDAIQTFVRPTAGAIAFAASTGAVSDVNPVLALGAGLLVAGGVHLVKSAAVRPAVTATTGGVANVPISILEDVLSTVMSVLAIALPLFFGLFLLLFAIWMFWWLWRRNQRRDLSRRA